MRMACSEWNVWRWRDACTISSSRPLDAVPPPDRRGLRCSTAMPVAGTRSGSTCRSVMKETNWRCVACSLSPPRGAWAAAARAARRHEAAQRGRMQRRMPWSQRMMLEAGFRGRQSLPGLLRPRLPRHPQRRQINRFGETEAFPEEASVRLVECLCHRCRKPQSLQSVQWLTAKAPGRCPPRRGRPKLAPPVRPVREEVLGVRKPQAR